MVASVFDCAGRAVSRMRTTSPPMLLGRKLLKKSGDEVRRQQRPRRHVHVLRAQQQLPAPRARQHVDRSRAPARSPATATEALSRAGPQTRPMSTREKSNASSPTLTTTSTARTRRGERGRTVGWSSDMRGGAARLYYGFVRKSRDRMRILMIAPEPFFEPRGTPFSEFHRIRALTDSRASGRSRHVSVRPGRARCRACASSASLRPPFVRAREDRTVAGEAAARCAADADRAPARARRAATTRSIRTRRAA